MTHPVMWFEVLGADGNRLRSFYGDLFGWTFNLAPTGYGVVEHAGRGIPGGVGTARDDMRSWVTFYVETADVTAALAKAEALGGKVVVPRMVTPNVTLGIFEDPEGHPIGLVETAAAQ